MLSIIRNLALFALVLLATVACQTKVSLFPDATEPLREFVIQGQGEGKVLYLPVTGVISDTPERSWLRPQPSMVQEAVAQLRLAEKDPEVKAVLLAINSPGGTSTGSDVLYHEIEEFKARTGVKVVSTMMDLAASGGYYVALASDRITAHPTTITGSVGVIFLRPKVYGLLDKIGVQVEVTKSGKDKDMGSPFREGTKEEEAILQGIIDEQAKRFTGLVEAKRSPGAENMKKISTARVFTAQEALDVKLIDEIAYISQAVAQAKKLAGLPEDAKVVAYRRTAYADDNLYNTLNSREPFGSPSLVSLGIERYLPKAEPGLYYLWLPE